MAKRWQPDPDHPLGSNEHVGRRIFDEPKLMGVDEQPNFGSFRIDHFRETREPEVSLDRLGRSSVEPKVKTYLLPRCDRQGGRFEKPKKFEGWAVIKARDLVNKLADLPKWELHASPEPLSGDEKYSDNEYHAHALCSENDKAYQSALFLRYLFERYGQAERGACEETADVLSRALPGTLKSVWDALVGMLWRKR